MKHEIGIIPSINNVRHVSGSPNVYPLILQHSFFVKYRSLDTLRHVIARLGISAMW